MISKEQVADLRPGDVVEVVRRERITIAEVTDDGRAFPWIGDGESSCFESLAVIRRAPRPLYVNHDRAEPVPGDVISSPADSVAPLIYVRTALKTWAGQDGGRYTDPQVPVGRRLLVDGETGQVVQ